MSSDNSPSSTMAPGTQSATTGPELDPLVLEWNTILSNVFGNIHAVEVASRIRREMPAWVAKVSNDIARDIEALVAKTCKDGLQADLANVRVAYEREMSARKWAEEELFRLRQVLLGCPSCSAAAAASTSNE
jgi:hypothetical protein